MRQQTVRAWLGRHPFVAFRIKAGSGDGYDAFHPDYVHLSEDERVLTIWTKDELRRDIDVLLIAAIEQMDADRHESTE